MPFKLSRDQIRRIYDGLRKDPPVLSETDEQALIELILDARPDSSGRLMMPPYLLREGMELDVYVFKNVSKKNKEITYSIAFDVLGTGKNSVMALHRFQIRDKKIHFKKQHTVAKIFVALGDRVDPKSFMREYEIAQEVSGTHAKGGQQNQKISAYFMRRRPGINLVEHKANKQSSLVASFHFDPSSTLKIFGKILDAYREFAAKELVHLDLKPANIMYDEKTEQLHIVDYGGLRDEGGLIGGEDATELYLSPEQAAVYGQTSGPIVLTQMPAVYSLGIILAEMKGWFSNSDISESIAVARSKEGTFLSRAKMINDKIISNIQAKKENFDEVENELANLILKMIKINPQERLELTKVMEEFDKIKLLQAKQNLGDDEESLGAALDVAHQEAQQTFAGNITHKTVVEFKSDLKRHLAAVKDDPQIIAHFVDMLRISQLAKASSKQDVERIINALEIDFSKNLDKMHKLLDKLEYLESLINKRGDLTNAKELKKQIRELAFDFDYTVAKDHHKEASFKNMLALNDVIAGKLVKWEVKINNFYNEQLKNLGESEKELDTFLQRKKQSVKLYTLKSDINSAINQCRYIEKMIKANIAKGKQVNNVSMANAVRSPVDGKSIKNSTGGQKNKLDSHLERLQDILNKIEYLQSLLKKIEHLPIAEEISRKIQEFSSDLNQQEIIQCLNNVPDVASNDLLEEKLKKWEDLIQPFYNEKLQELGGSEAGLEKYLQSKLDNIKAELNVAIKQYRALHSPKFFNRFTSRYRVSKARENDIKYINKLIGAAKTKESLVEALDGYLDQIAAEEQKMFGGHHSQLVNLIDKVLNRSGISYTGKNTELRELLRSTPKP